MKSISLIGKHGSGKFTLVDDGDFPFVSRFRWYVDNKGYAYRERCGRNRIFLHQLIMGAYPSGKSEIDHVNGDKLDNRSENLRFCTSQENRHNRRKYKNNHSGVLGVQWHKASGKWLARIYRDKKAIYLGTFKELSEAQEAIKKAKS